MAEERRIRLTREFTGYVDESVDGYRFRVTASDAVGMPAEVFAYLAAPPAPGGEPRAAFSHVCSPADLEEYPVDAPAPGAVPAWFRTTTVDLVVRSAALADEAWTALATAVVNLKCSLDRLDDLDATETLWIGTPPP